MALIAFWVAVYIFVPVALLSAGGAVIALLIVALVLHSEAASEIDHAAMLARLPKTPKG